MEIGRWTAASVGNQVAAAASAADVVAPRVILDTFKEKLIGNLSDRDLVTMIHRRVLVYFVRFVIADFYFLIGLY